jgi:hypothetical protein
MASKCENQTKWGPKLLWKWLATLGKEHWFPVECLPGPDVSQIAGHFGGCLALVQDLNGQPSFQYDNIYIYKYIYIFIYLFSPQKDRKGSNHHYFSRILLFYLFKVTMATMGEWNSWIWCWKLRMWFSHSCLFQGREQHVSREKLGFKWGSVELTQES